MDGWVKATEVWGMERGGWKAMRNNHFVVTTKQADWSENFYTHSNLSATTKGDLGGDDESEAQHQWRGGRKRFYGRLIIFHVLEHARDTEREEGEKLFRRQFFVPFWSSPRSARILSFTVFMVSNFSHAMSQSKSFPPCCGRGLRGAPNINPRNSLVEERM